LRKPLGKLLGTFWGLQNPEPKKKGKKLGLLLFYSYWLISLDAKKNIFPPNIIVQNTFLPKGV
jgi:hypothetical protein